MLQAPQAQGQPLQTLTPRRWAGSSGRIYIKEEEEAACRGKYFTLQSAGMHRDGVQPAVAAYVWRAAVQPALLYAAECVPLRTVHLTEMDKLHVIYVRA